MITADASVVVAALTLVGDHGDWAREMVSRPLLAPSIIRAEVASSLRRHVLTGDLQADFATSAHRDAVNLRISLVPYEVLADRIWELRMNITPYDAWYVAAAEASNSMLATLDQKLANAPGTRCDFLTPA